MNIELIEPIWILGAVPLIIFILVVMPRSFTKMQGDKKIISKSRKIVAVSRIIVIVLLFVALANPTILATSESPTPPRIVMLVDNSSSMDVFDLSFVDKLENDLSREIPVEKKIISGGTNSDLGNQVLASLKKDSNILLVSDGWVTKGTQLGDVAIYSKDLNAKINAINLESSEKDVSVSIVGPSKTVTDADNTFVININELNTNSYKLAVEVDGEPVNTVQDGGNIFLTKKFDKEGFHTIKASLAPSEQDFFIGNNEFFKTIKVVERPKILFLSQKQDPVVEIFKSLYDVQESSTLPDDLSPFYAVVINDMPASSIESLKLNDYLINGNGLFVIGGAASFDNGGYKNSDIESLLPVTVGTGQRKATEANIAIVIDISGSTTGTTAVGGYIADVEKALAVNILNELSEKNKFGVVAFNTEAYLIQNMTLVKSGREEGVNNIARLQTGGGTTISEGLKAAYGLLKNYRGGSNNIILISDGKSNGALDKEKSRELVDSYRKNGIKVYTIGVGSDTNEEFMKELALFGGGSYFAADETNNIKVLFGDPGDQPPSGFFSLVPVDTSHFITSDLVIKPLLDSYNQVSPKDSAKLLMLNDFGNPAVVVWRYGIGRAATLTVYASDNSLGGLLNRPHSLLLTRMTNWVIGDPERKLAYIINTEDGRIDETVAIKIRSKSYPSSDVASFVKTDEDTYSAKIKPENTGFFTILGAKYAVSYEKEYQSLGMNPDLVAVVENSGGKIFNANDVNSIVQSVRESSRQQRVVESSLQWLLLAAALAVFLVEVCVRRIKAVEWGSS